MNFIVKIVQPSGILNGVTANKMRRQISDVIDKGADIVLVDFQDVTFMNSSGLGVLISTLRVVHAGGNQLFICFSKSHFVGAGLSILGGQAKLRVYPPLPTN
jgi:anti-sigma B factor antagonist